ncbi:MAG: hypothetical protein GQ534_12555 [Candidatus Delongbacteria bacterium]|nr:hypothetical protein [Candidatus Delongbacteria bacterium]
MKYYFIKIISFIAILASEAWFLYPTENWKFNWEPLIVFLVSIIAYISLESYDDIKKKKNNKQVPSQNDIKLFESLIKLIPSDSIIQFLKDHDFKSSFRFDYVKPIYEFLALWNNVEHEFLDKEIDNLRQELHKSAQHLMNEIGVKTFHNKADLHSVKPEEMHGPMPEKIIQNGVDINEAADVFVEAHEKFVRLAKKKLYS